MKLFTSARCFSLLLLLLLLFLCLKLVLATDLAEEDEGGGGGFGAKITSAKTMRQEDNTGEFHWRRRSFSVSFFFLLYPDSQFSTFLSFFPLKILSRFFAEMAPPPEKLYIYPSSLFLSKPFFLSLLPFNFGQRKVSLSPLFLLSLLLNHSNFYWRHLLVLPSFSHLSGSGRNLTQKRATDARKNWFFFLSAEETKSHLLL